MPGSQGGRGKDCWAQQLPRKGSVALLFRRSGALGPLCDDGDHYDDGDDDDDDDDLCAGLLLAQARTSPAENLLSELLLLLMMGF